MPHRKAHAAAEAHTHEAKASPASGVEHLRVRVDGLDSPGSCPVPEARVGDVLLWLLASDGTTGNHGFFEPVVTVDGELQQRRSLPGHCFDAILLRGV